MMPPSLANGLSHARVLVCAGTGGVGKTTIAAALGIEAARQGRRALVLTIDPARRLADALGLSGMDSKPMPVDLPEELFETGSETSDAPRGHLDALMLDPKPTFDRLITRLTRDEAARRRILENRIYRHLSEALAGSAEYAAMEQVHEMVESGSYDLVIVDTPPSNHALDFLSAPRRLREFLESRFVQALVRPAMTAGLFGFKIFGRSLRRMFGLLERIAGIGFLDDLTEFLTAIDGLSEGFRERATRVEEVLLGADTSFILVCGIQAGTEPGTLEFLDELDELGRASCCRDREPRQTLAPIGAARRVARASFGAGHRPRRSDPAERVRVDPARGRRCSPGPGRCCSAGRSAGRGAARNRGGL